MHFINDRISAIIDALAPHKNEKMQFINDTISAIKDDYAQHKK